MDNKSFAFIFALTHLTYEKNNVRLCGGNGFATKFL